MKYQPPITDEELERSIEANPFAEGGGREVFNALNDPLSVVKRARGFPMTNFVEWLVWNAIKGTALSPLFGECKAISFSGRYLIMERLDDINSGEYHLIPHMPDWLNDRKPSAFGKANGGLIKVRDYGMVRWEDVLNTPVFPVPLASRRNGWRQN